MTTELSVSDCVDCGVTILGERPRCPACHDRHAAELLAATPGDDDATAPRRRASGASTVLARWFVVVELTAIVVLGLAVAARGCAP